MKIIPTIYKDAARAKNIFIPLFQKESPSQEEFFVYLPESVKTAVLKLAKEEFRGEEGETKSVWFPKGNITRVRLFGLGDKSKWNYRKAQLLPRNYVQYAKNERVSNFAAGLKIFGEKKPKEIAFSFAVNAAMAEYEFNKYKERPKSGWPKIEAIGLLTEKKYFIEIKNGIREGLAVGEEVNNCRELANTPGGDMTPAKLAEAARAAAKKYGFGARILEEKEMKRLKMGGILGVGRGSNEKPKFIILEYKHGAREQKPLVLVGKGVTFDTGGLNLKTRQSIAEMHLDMSGGAAVIHGISAIAKLKMKINVIGLIPAVENMPSGSSYHPGDLLKTMSGKTIEILDTDAEGRTILSDALFYGTRYKPGLMVDFATLTGAAHVALGSYSSALLSNEEDLHPKLMEIGKRSGDYVWPLPLWDEYLQDIKGTFGDVANLGKKGSIGDAINGAKFLEQFVGKTRWAHIDIAPRMTTVESEYLAKGASGVGVRFIVELAKNYQSLL